MKPPVVTILCIVSCMILSVAFQETGNKVFDKIDQYLSDMEEAGNSGQVLVAVDGEVYRRGFGKADKENNIPFTPETITGTGSITKQFTGAAILKLEMHGKLKTTDLLTKYFKNIPKDKQSITLHHLLTHSAGFPGAIGDDYAAISTDQFMEMAMKSTLAFEPGKGYQYSNVGFTILAILVEKRSGMTYEEFLNKELFQPAGMTETGYILPDWTDNQLAVGYRNGKLWGKLNEKNWGKEGPYWHLKGNGGILSNGDDMYKWHQALLGNKILSDDAKKKYYGKHVREGEGADSFYGYGWAIMPTPRGTDLITHNGGNGTFMADFLRYPKEDVTIWFATNGVSRANRNTGWEIARMIFQPEYQAKVKVMTEVGQLTAEDEIVKGALLRMLKGDDEQSIVEFVTAQFSPVMMDMAPMEKHAEIIGGIRKELFGFELKKENKTMDEMILTFSKEEYFVDVLLNIENGKIVGMGIDN
jgi:CubicO group peptidase (beta-lactamase class C family)